MTDAGGRRLLMLGGGGHARVLQELLVLRGETVGGYFAPAGDSLLDGVEWLGDDDALDSLDPSTVLLINAVGSVRAATSRRSVYENAVRRGFEFLTLVDPTATVRPSVSLGAGVQVLAGAIVNTDAVVGPNTILNSGSIIEHHARIGASVHVSPGAVIGGGVRVGDGTHVGLGARVLHGLSIGSDCTIGAGAVVIHDVADGVVAVGVPAVARQAGTVK